MALINGKLDGKLACHKMVLSDRQTNFPFHSHTTATGLFLVFSNVPGVIYEVSLQDALIIITDAIKTGFVKAILLEDGLYILDDQMSGDKIRSLFVTLEDFLAITDNVIPSRYIGYIFLEHGVRFEIKGIS